MSGNGSGSSSGRTLGCGRGRELSNTSCGLLGAGVERMTLYRFVDDQKAEGFPVRMVCSVVGVSPSAYYAYKKRPEAGAAQLAEAVLVDEIRAIWAESGGTYGSAPGVRRATPARPAGEPQTGGAADEVPPHGRFRSPQGACHHHTPFAHRIPDLLAGDFGASTLDEAWVGDISYIRTRQGFLYLAFVLDLASRRVVGVSMAPHLKASLATDALREAIATRGGQVRGVVFHSDRGSQYTSGATARLCKAYGIRQSVGRTGVWGDNAAAESFLGTLKKELVNRNNYRAATRPACRSDGGSKPGTTPAGSTPPSGTSHRTNGRTTTTITRPHKPSVQHIGGSPNTARSRLSRSWLVSA